MGEENNEKLKKLLRTFRVEAGERLQAMSSALLALEKSPPGTERLEIIETIFREVHSLKGAARAVNLTQIESVCQALESLFAALKDGQFDFSSSLLDLLHETVDAIGALTDPESAGSEAGSAEAEAFSRRLDEARKEALAAAGGTSASKPADPGTTAPETESRASTVPPADLTVETVRVSTAKLDTVMRQTEELLVPRLASTERARVLRETAGMFAAWQAQRTRIQPALRRVERATADNGDTNSTARVQYRELLEYLDAEEWHMSTLKERLAWLRRSAEHDQRVLAGLSDRLLANVKDMQLLPCSSLLELLPRLARELARAQGKEVQVNIRGAEIELDRRLLEEMKDPLTHILRNSIDHGIENPDVRPDGGKPAQGEISITVSQKDSGKIQIEVSDDGAGIDTSGLRAAVSRAGLIDAEEVDELDDRQVLEFAFRSGVTTSPLITDISGRGLGLAIVREKIERLGGNIDVASRAGAGTGFSITLPLTLATFHGVLVNVDEQLCIIPAVSIERVMRVAASDIRTVENRETISVNGQAVALMRLGDVLEIPRKSESAAHTEGLTVVILGPGPGHIAFSVDTIVGEQEVLVKPLGPQLARVRNITGACVLGTGKVVPVLNVPDLLRAAVKPAPPVQPAVDPEVKAATKKQSILVVEDSITSRALLKNILESAGFSVATAVDGVDAYTRLKTRSFDLVVSDVEMPRMDGFDLTARIRADKHLADMPVMLVTALESSADRERGVDAGANAYIVKSSFDQSNLLKVVRQLI